MLTEFLQATFNGLSLASILILMGLGLSIVFGLMNVINMAHGEFMMFGAFTTYVVAELFRRYLPRSAYSWYWVCVPAAVAGVCWLFGSLCERYLIRRLYGDRDREADSLLVTLGLSAIMIDLAKLTFGNNEAVLAPKWLVGVLPVVGDFTLPRSRLFIMVYSAAIFTGTVLFLKKTAAGRKLRTATQSAAAASKLGIEINQTNNWAFALGAVLAGLAGAALTPIYSINPEMGGLYIVLAFLVVVVGGKGNIMGTLWASLILGLLTDYLEPTLGAVWTQVLVSVCVVLFLLLFPRGVSTEKGRAANVRV